MTQQQERQEPDSRPVWRYTGFLSFIAVAYLNATLDLGHKILVQNTLFKAYDGPEQVLLTAIVNALILLPFILLFTPAGFLSDRFSKPAVMRGSAAAAIGLTLMITACYYQGWFIPAFVLTFFLAAQSALYSPAKYGFIRELVGANNLSEANGWVQAATIISILGAIVLFSLLFEQRLALTEVVEKSPEAVMRQIAPLGWLLVALAVVEWLLAWRLPAGGAHPQLRLDRHAYWRGQLLRENLGRVTAHKPILYSIFGLALFWSISQVMIAVYPAYVKAHLGEVNTFYIQGALAQSGIGILVGSIMVARLSRHHINVGLIPFGALLVTLGLGLLPASGSLLSAGVLFFLVGVGGALAIVPLNALIQFHAPSAESGSILAGNNLIQNVAMFSALVMTVASAFAEVPARSILVVLALAAAVGALIALVRLPEAFLRLLVRLLLKRRYRLDILGFDQIPRDGRGVLLVGNHVSWLDWALVQIACPRHVHFVMERVIYERWYLSWLLRLYRVIPISSGSSRDAMTQVARLLEAGEVVCIFPEGAISRSGQLGPFKRGFERAAAQVASDADVIILPFYLRGLWGSRFSRSTARMRSARRAGWKRDVTLAFGAPLPLNTDAVTLRSQVSELAIHAWEAYTNTLDNLPAAFIRTARAAPSAWALTELEMSPFSHLRLLTAAMVLARRFRRLEEERIGVLLPTAAGGVVGLLGLLMSGKTIVPLNYTASREALASASERAGLKIVVTSSLFLKRLGQRGIDPLSALGDVKLIELEWLRDQIGNGERLATLVQARMTPVWLLQKQFGGAVPIDHTAAILFSSGSEGQPKGIVLSHRNIMANLKQVADVFNIEDEDCVLGSLPLFHAFGLTATTMMPLIEGVPLVCHPDPTDAVNIGKCVARWRVSLLCATSTFLRLYARQSRLLPSMFEPLRLVVAGAERLSPRVREQFEGRFNKRILEGYGCTETTPVASVNLPDYLDTRFWTVQVGNKTGSVGMALPGSCFRVADPDSFDTLPTGEPGMVLIGGAQIMQGYLDDPQRTESVILHRDGLRWYVTGDKGYLDEEGFLTLIDRYSRFVKIGGEMVSLGAVESQAQEVLDRPLIATSVADERKGEQVVLLVEGDEGEEGLREQLRASGMSPLMLPARVFVQSQLPFLGSGKPDLYRARIMALDLCRNSSS
ncbi:acyl-[ACP]--phospholipid O-acyltransferase [Marinobacterium litorale]|uniref:acyl-[ACP]--phospholipid O-acyltransferase n=1 Tax=Marinobacterium litorale TaxID=404770 RepID=UPI0004244C87|nr:acyl-[ACP]--phospholipid O-acyltransferase [Marinobacterium litorale]